MKEIDRKKYLLWARTASYRRKVERSKAVVVQALAVGANWYCAFSGGKDSTVVHHLTGFTPIHWDDELYLPETRDFLAEIKSLVRLAKTSVHCSFFKNWEQGTTNMPYFKQEKNVYKIMKEFGYNGVALGLRCEENHRRRVLLGKKGPLWQLVNKTWYCNPIYDWRALDIWAYIVSNDVIYNKAYDKLRELGLQEEQCRIGPLFQERVLGMGQVAILKMGWPDLYYSLVKRFPEITNYV